MASPRAWESRWCSWDLRAVIVPVDPGHRRARQLRLAGDALNLPGSDETVSLGHEVGRKQIAAILDRSPHRFGFHRWLRVLQAPALLRGEPMTENRPKPISPRCSCCGEQPKFTTSILDSPTGRTFAMFECRCGNRTLISEKKEQTVGH